jgi:DNA polymerase elongation subunit (family B)
MSFNMSPETLVDGAKFLPDTEESIQKLMDKDVDMSFARERDFIVTANGQCFHKANKGIFPELIEHYFSLRQKSKKQMFQAQKKYDETNDDKYLKDITRYNCMQMAAKILMNSLYGATSNVYFRYYDTRVAEGITMTGQYIIKSVSEELNKYLNRVSDTKNIDYSFYCDTDSAYFTLENWVNKNHKGKTKKELVDIVDQYCNKNIEPTINKACTDIFNYLNGYADNIKFKREVIADRGIWIAKKRYALNVHNSEGIAYNPPKLKVLGMEIVRSSTPAPVRKALKEAVSIALTKDEMTLRQFVADLEIKWHSLDPEDIAFPRGVNGIKEYADSNGIFRKGTPIHVRGALIYNHLVTSKGLEKKYQLIQEGDKIKFLYLREPNPLGTHVITFAGEVPPEFKIREYIDYDKMFEKSFLEPLNSLLSCIGWQVKETASLEGLFG